MDMQDIGWTVGLAIAGLVLFFIAWQMAQRQRSRARLATAPEQPAAEAAPAGLTADPLARRLERRMEEIEAAQADLADRLAGFVEENGAAKLQAMAGSLLGLVRDKNATLETALAGLDGLRARLAALEAVGDLSEANKLFEGLRDRITALEAAQVRAVETRSAELREAEARLEARLEARTTVAEAPGALVDIAETLARLHAQKEAAVETVFARLGPLEAKLGEIEGRMAGLDPQAALDRFAERLETVRGELEDQIAVRGAANGAGDGAGAEHAAAPDAAVAAAGSQISEIAEAFGQLYAQKDAATETVFARLLPLEEKLSEISGRMSGLDPQAAFERFTERLDAARDLLQNQIDALRAEQGAERAPAEHPFGDVAEQLARLYAQKDAAVETVLGRLGPLEDKLRDLEIRIAELDPAAALERFGERLEAVQARLGALDDVDARLHALDAMGQRLDTLDTVADRLDTLDSMGARIGVLEAGEGTARDVVAAIATQFARIQEGKDAAVETVLGRLGPLETQLARVEARLGGEDPGPALARIDARLEAVAERVAELEGAARDAGNGGAVEFFERITLLQAEREAALTAVMARLGPLETRLADIESRAADGAAAREDLAAMAEKIQGLRQELRVEIQAEVRAAEAAAREAVAGFERVAALREAGVRAGDDRLAAFGERLAGLHDQREAVIGALLSQVGALEEKLGGMEVRIGDLAPQAAVERLEVRIGDLAPQAAVDQLEARIGDLASQGGVDRVEARLDTRVDAMQGRIDVLEDQASRPLLEITDQLTRLYAHKDAAVETVLGRLEPLEVKLALLEARVVDPTAALDRVQARLESAQTTLQSQIDTLRENPFAEVSEQLTKLYAQKDAAVETVFARLAPLEAKLAEIEARIGGLDPQAALDRFAERLDAARAGLQVQIDDLREENPFAEVSEQLTRLYAQKDATLEAVLGWLAPLEAKLAEVEGRVRGLDPQAALDRFAERLDAARAGLQSQIDDLREENPFAEVSEQLTRLYAQKDAAVETVFTRLAPIEVRLAEIEAQLGEVDPGEALDRFAERLGTINERLAAVEEEAPYAVLTERLTELHEKKDAAVEAIFARLSPIEGKLEGMEARVDALDPAAALARFAERVEAAERTTAGVVERLGAIENPGGAINTLWAEIGGLRQQRDVALEAVSVRIASLERLLEEAEMREMSEAEARAEAQAIATQMVAAKTVEQETRLFANRLALLEASLPRLTLSQSLMMQALERQSVSWESSFTSLPPQYPGGGYPGQSYGAQHYGGQPSHPHSAPAGAGSPAPQPTANGSGGPAHAGGPFDRAIDLPDIWRNPRVVSLHQGGS